MPSTQSSPSPGPVSVDPRWTAVLTRDSTADGSFFYSVRTTGVFCRPSCPSRRPRPENVAFHATADEAQRAGFRPCKRCRPESAPPADGRARRIADVCRLLDRAEEMPTLAQLADRAGLSPHHFHRMFKSAVGLTPREYAAAARAGRLREALSAGEGVTRAIYGAGYGSSSRFYESAQGTLGMTPSEYRAGAPELTITYAVGRSSLGAVLVAHSGRGICAVLLGDDDRGVVEELGARFSGATVQRGDAAFHRMLADVVAVIETPGRPFSLPLDVRGTAFQQRVWKALREVPPGTTISYKEIAARIGAAGGARAVARACAANPAAVIVPCHRVVGSDGRLSGYRWGADRKRKLLEREGPRSR